MELTLKQNQNVFSGARELERLATQNRLMRECEAPIFRELFAGRRGLNVLDVGCNDGEKTVRWFSDPAVEKVLALELDEKLAARAQEAFGGETFRFCSCDVEAENFPAQLGALLRREGRDGVDVIYISFLLSHLKQPETLLRLLRPLLRPGGCLVAVETDDARAALTPDDRRFREFLDMLAGDPYAGDRSVGGRLNGMLTRCGYADPVLLCGEIAAGPGEAEKKAMIFEMFFSYLPGDVALLRAGAPEDVQAAAWERWLGDHYAALRCAICAPESRVSMGMSVVTCTANSERA